MKKFLCTIIIISLIFVPPTPFSSSSWAKKIDYKKNPSGFDIAATLVTAILAGCGRAPSFKSVGEYVRHYVIPKILTEAGAKYGGKYGRILGAVIGEAINAFGDYSGMAKDEAEKAGITAAQEQATEETKKAAEEAGNKAAEEAYAEAKALGHSDHTANQLAAQARHKALKTRLLQDKGAKQAFTEKYKSVVKNINTGELVRKAAIVRATTLGAVSYTHLTLPTKA